MKRKLFLLLCALLTSVGMWATGWTGNTVAEGEYYLYNVGGDCFLGFGENWGTRATADHAGIPVTLQGTGTYKLITNVAKKGNALKADGYVDGDAADWTFTDQNVDGKHVYTIKTGDKFLYYNPTENVDHNSGLIVSNNISGVAAANTQWQLVTKAQRDAAFEAKNASESAPLDITYKYIENPNTTFYIDVYTIENPWTKGGNKNWTLGGNQDWWDAKDKNGEVWNNTFDNCIEITGIPNGIYEFGVQGFYRDGGKETAVDHYTAEPSAFVGNAKIYANSDETPMQSIVVGYNTSVIGGDNLNDGKDYSKTVGGTTYCIPNCQTGVALYMVRGKYPWQYVRTVVTDGKLKFGVKKSATIADDWTIVDKFYLSYLGEDISIYEQPLADAKTAAKGINQSAHMNAGVLSALQSALSSYGDRDFNTYSTGEEITAAISALNTAANNATTSIGIYENINTEISTYATKATALDAAGQATYDASAVQDGYDDGTYETLEEAQADLFAAYSTAVKAQTTDGADMTEAIANPSFESATGVSTTIAGWTNEANKTLQTQSNKGPGDTFRVGNYYAERWHSTGEKHIHQTVTGLHAGAYVLTAKAYASNVTSAKVYVKVGETESAIDVAATNDYSVLFNYDGTSELKIGFFSNMGEDGSNNWICIDNFRLTYSGESQPDLPLYTTEPMNATAKENANTAIKNYNANKTSENYTAAESAIAVAEASKTAYNRASLEGYKSRMGELLAKTNVYTEAAYNKWYANVDDNYADGIYTDEEVVTLTAAGACQGATEHTHKKANRIDDVLLSTWTIGGEQCSDYDKSLYINTWSLEGNNDGSGFQTPFFEYWTSDGNSLGEASLAATMTGLEASTSYSIEMWARVRQTDNQTKVADKIMLKVGSGDAVDIAAGAQHTTHGTSNFYNGHFTATGSTDESGNLTITIMVAANSNVSWLSFKDVAVSKQATTGDVQTYSGLINNDTELVPTAAAPIVDITEASFNGALTANFSSNANGFIIATAEQKAALGDVKNVVVGNTCDNLVLTDGVKAVIPAALTQAAEATYSRTISATTNFGTICLPFNVVSDENIQFYTVSEITGENVLNLLTTDEVAAGTPAIFKKKTAEATNVEVVTTDATVTNVEGVQAATNVQLIGAYSPIMVGANDSQGKASDSYYISANKFYQGKNYFYIDPFRAYLKTVVLSGARLTISIDGETDINAIEAIEAEANALKDGKYIIDNKVVIVKNGVKYDANGKKLN